MATIDIKNFKGKGRGVIAKKRIPKGAFIEECPVLLFKVPVGTKHMLEGFAFRWSTTRVALTLGYGSLYNHSYSPNAVFVPDKRTKTIRVIACEAINKGEEICIDYTGGVGSKVWFSVK